MAEMRLKFSEGEFALKDGVTTIGRTPDNDVSFPADPNVSRCHAEIELRGGEFCLIDLSSSNGTAVNGSRISGDTYLRPGDRIMLGGTSELIFDEHREDAVEAVENPAADADLPLNLPPVGIAVQQLPSVASAPASAGSKTMLMIAGGAVLLAVVVVGVAGTIYYRKSTASCGATAKITSPEKGETLLKPTDIEVQAEKTGCIKSMVFTLDNKEFAQADDSPYTATIDPKDHADQADGEYHTLGIVLIDNEGKRLPQPDQIPLILETRKLGKLADDPEPEQEQGPGPQDQQPALPSGKTVSLIDIRDETIRFAKQFPGGRAVPNKEFLLDVQKRTADFTRGGHYGRAAAYRDLINVAFVRDKNLPPAFGFIFAMSRSGFDPRRQGDGEGLWQTSQTLFSSQNFGGQCGESLSDPKQTCASVATAAYLKELYFSACGEDFLCAAAAFGKSIQDAAAWKSNQANSGSGLWNTLKGGPEREQIVKFVAAGIVAGNPQRFGLDQDKPISTLYP